jgi:hypothetical protein
MNKHGEFLLSWEVNLLVVKAKGPFNEEGTFAGIVEIEKFVSAKNIAPWCKLGIWDKESLGSPVALQMVKDYHEWCIKNGCVRTAYVVHNSIQKSVAEKLYGSKAKVFRLESEARKWLFSQSNT